MYLYGLFPAFMSCSRAIRKPEFLSYVGKLLHDFNYQDIVQIFIVKGR